MPYIKPAERLAFEAELEKLAAAIDVHAVDKDGNINKGKLNYVLTSLVERLHFTRNYDNMSNIKGALEDAACEYYRRRLAPYEDKKIAENGDVYRFPQ